MEGFRDHNTLYYGKLIQFWRDFIMKKFILVVFIGIVLAINLYGIITDITHDEVSYVDEVTIVHTE